MLSFHSLGIWEAHLGVELEMEGDSVIGVDANVGTVAAIGRACDAIARIMTFIITVVLGLDNISNCKDTTNSAHNERKGHFLTFLL
ncbi:MAG: hypothetical protein IJT30_05190 [Muribaculaceae bacterium]|nr:hypothetical protein [Muribaculaceae bacterium]